MRSIVFDKFRRSAFLYSRPGMKDVCREAKDAHFALVEDLQSAAQDNGISVLSGDYKDIGREPHERSGNENELRESLNFPPDDEDGRTDVFLLPAGTLVVKLSAEGTRATLFCDPYLRVPKAGTLHGGFFSHIKADSSGSVAEREAEALVERICTDSASSWASNDALREFVILLEDSNVNEASSDASKASVRFRRAMAAEKLAANFERAVPRVVNPSALLTPSTIRWNCTDHSFIAGGTVVPF